MMTRKVAPTVRGTKVVGTVAVLVALMFGVPTSALAQHRARLSSDLYWDIAKQPDKSLRVIIETNQSEVDRLVKTYGVRLGKRMESGAVLLGTGKQFDKLAGDLGVSELSEDQKVFGSMALT